MTKVSSDAPHEPGTLLLLESVFALAVARLIVLLVPFRVYSRAMGRDGESPAETIEPDHVRQVSRAIASASRHTPWRSKCLEQAFAAKAMLRRRRIPNTLYIALAREVGLEAHAWVRSGDVCVTGQADFDRYTVVGRFADEGKR